MEYSEPHSVRIIAPQHPFYGNTLPVLRKTSLAGVSHLVVRLPDGQTQALPIPWTAPLSEPFVNIDPSAKNPVLFYPYTLRNLVNMVAFLKGKISHSQEMEACHGFPHPDPDFSSRTLAPPSSSDPPPNP